MRLHRSSLFLAAFSRSACMIGAPGLPGPPAGGKAGFRCCCRYTCFHERDRIAVLMMCLQLRLKMSYSLCFIFHVSCCFISVGKTPASIKRRINQYPARLSGGLQSPTEINAQLHNAPQEHCYACIGTRGCAGIRFGRCQLALTRIPRQFSRARIELSGYKLQTFRGKVVYTSTR